MSRFYNNCVDEASLTTLCPICLDSFQGAKVYFCPLKGMIQFCLMGLVVPSISGGCRKLLGPFGVLVARWAAFFIVQ